MKSYEIVDGSRRDAAPCAKLDYDEEKDEYSIHVDEETELSELPAILRILAEQGTRELDDRLARLWVIERIVPPSRQNLGSVLKANGLERYDIHALLVAGEGRCAQDDFFIRTVDSPGLRASARQRVGAQLAKLRARAGMSQLDLAQATGVQQAVISRIENGKQNATVEMLDLLARAVGGEVAICGQEATRCG